jgi:hypothetical protein
VVVHDHVGGSARVSRGGVPIGVPGSAVASKNLNRLTACSSDTSFYSPSAQCCLRLRLQTSQTCVVVFSGYRIFLANENSQYSIKFQISPNCHFHSLSLVRNSNLEFEFMHHSIRFGQLKECNSSFLDLSLDSTNSSWVESRSLRWTPYIGPVATGGCGLETSIWPLIILFRGYGSKLGAFLQRLGGPTLKYRSSIPI